MNTLRTFIPDAVNSDWHLENAGQRVQIIKQCNQKWGKLEFGTEIVAAKDGTLAALLGASPGASVSVKAMIDVIERCFAQQVKSSEWQEKLGQMLPSYGKSLIEDKELLIKVRRHNHAVLKLE